MAAPPRKAAGSKATPRSRPRSHARGATPDARARTKTKREIVPASANGSHPARRHHDADEAASAAAVGVVLLGPFLLAGAIGVRVVRQIVRAVR